MSMAPAPRAAPTRGAHGTGRIAGFLTVAAERSFSRAAEKLHRTQPAVSQAIRRLEDELGERLFDRSSKQGTLTEAGRVLREYAQRLSRLSEEAETAVRELRDLRRGRVLIGANEGAVHALLPLIGRFRTHHPEIQVDVRRVASRRSASRCRREVWTSAS
jgi:DNA-binding transcriptional LysR family regulator